MTTKYCHLHPNTEFDKYGFCFECAKQETSTTATITPPTNTSVLVLETTVGQLRAWNEQLKQELTQAIRERDQLEKVHAEIRACFKDDTEGFIVNKINELLTENSLLRTVIKRKDEALKQIAQELPSCSASNAANGLSTKQCAANALNITPELLTNLKGTKE